MARLTELDGRRLGIPSIDEAYEHFFEKVAREGLSEVFDAIAHAVGWNLASRFGERW